MKLSWLGDSVVLLDFEGENLSAPDLLRHVLGVADSVKQARIPGVLDVTSAFTSIAVYLDPVQTAPTDESTIEHLFGAVRSAAGDGRQLHGAGRIVDIPVCYDAEFALDLERAAELLRMSPQEIIATHCAAEFVVACLGFMPGFPYLAGLPESLRLPRLMSPRTRVPAGSVAIAGGQAGIYPFDSPGGWNVLGRTPLPLFDPSANPPARLQPGDRVRFRPIERKGFEGFGRKQE